VTAYETVGYMLNSSTAVTAITSTRIYHGLRPEHTTVPCINYYEIGGGEGRRAAMESVRYSVNCRAATPAMARDLAREVVTLFGGESGTGIYGNEDGFDVARASISVDGGLIPETEERVWNAPVEVVLVYPSKAWT
jgi:hypothetical protein